MKLVVDANVLFAAFIKDSTTRKMILEKQIELFTPYFVLEEIEKYAPYLFMKSGADPRQFKHIKDLLFQKIKVIPKHEVEPFIGEGKRISPDINDKHYFALAIKLGIPIWSNDKKLKKQEQVGVYNTREILGLLGNGKSQ
ncbi:MAG: PIN domain-containing protein [archaeon]